MSFAMPFVRSASDEGAEARVSALGLAAIAIGLFVLAAFSPAALGDGFALGDGRMDHRPWRHAARGSVQLLDGRRAVGRA